MVNKKSFLTLLLLALLCVTFYRHQILGDRTIPFDSKDQFYLIMRFATEAYRSGELPLWNPYVFAGTPAVGDPSYHLFSPLVIAPLSIPAVLSQRYFDLVLILHVLFAGFFTFLLARNFNISWAGSILAAITLMFGGPATARVQHVAGIYVLAYFPLAFLFLKQGLDSGSLIKFVLGGVISALILISGSHLGFLSFLVFFGYFAFRVLVEVQRFTFLKAYAFPFIVFCVLAAGLAAIQIVPSLEFAQLSNRPQFDYALAAAHSLSPLVILTLLFPNFFGALDLKAHWGPGDPTEMYIYLGILPLFLAIWAVIRWSSLNKEQKFCAFLGMVALLYALGRFTPIYFVLFHTIPGLRLFRRPSDSLFLFHFAMAILTGAGLDSIAALNLAGMSTNKFLKFLKLLPIILVSTAVVALALFLTWHLLGNSKPYRIYQASLSIFWFAIFLSATITIMHRLRKDTLMSLTTVSVFLILAVAFTDLLLFNSGNALNSASTKSTEISANSIYNDRKIIPFLKAGLESGKGQFYRIEPVYAGSMWHNGPAIWRIHSTAGYGPLFYRRFDEFASAYNEHLNPREFKGLIISYNSSLFDLLNVKYIITPRDLRNIDPTVSPEKFRKVYDSWYKVYENVKVLPRAYIVHKAKIVDSSEKLKDELLRESFNPREVVLIERVPLGLREQIVGNTVELPSSIADQVSIVHYRLNEIILKAKTEAGGFLFLSEIFYPGWKVYIDDKETELLRANYLFRAVHLEAGNHMVRFVFDPFSFKIGAAVTLISIIVALVLVTKSLFKAKYSKVTGSCSDVV